MSQRIQYKLCTLVYKLFVGQAAEYSTNVLAQASDIPCLVISATSVNCDLISRTMIDEKSFSADD